MPDEKILLDATLRPSPPMPARALFVVLAIVAAINFCIASYFIARGAWPVSPFMGADVLLLAWAFRASRIASRREEHVTLTPSCLRVARRPARGPSEFTFNPYWVRVVMDKPVEEALAEHACKLTLWSHGRFLRIGAFLAPSERAVFGERLKSALRMANSVSGS